MRHRADRMAWLVPLGWEVGCGGFMFSFFSVLLVNVGWL
jgi:hypothetical protein